MKLFALLSFLTKILVNSGIVNASNYLSVRNSDYIFTINLSSITTITDFVEYISGIQVDAFAGMALRIARNQTTGVKYLENITYAFEELKLKLNNIQNYNFVETGLIISSCVLVLLIVCILICILKCVLKY